MKKIWISKELLEWDYAPSGGSVIDPKFKQRAYEIWEHANDLIEKETEKFNLEDAIINLKRTIDQRLKLIEDIYGFKKNNKNYKNIPYLELLEKFGIIRNNMMKKLLQIRNGIEHRDENAPSKERCIELSDMVWYFLKTTDNIVSIKREYIDTTNNYKCEESQYGFDMEIKYDNGLEVSLAGWVPNECVKETKEEDFLEINANDVHGKEKFKDKSWYNELHKDKLDSDLWINGTFELNENDKLEFLKKIFK